MASLKLDQYGGMLPAWDRRLLPNGQAARSENGYLFSGALTAWRAPKQLHVLDNPAARYAYRIPFVVKTQARAYLVATVNAADGETVTINDLTYTFRNILTLTGTAGGPAVHEQLMEVAIGNTPTATLTNLSQAITADRNQNTHAGINYSTNTPSNTAVYFSLPDTDPITGLVEPTIGVETINGNDYAYLLLGAVDFGASYNMIPVAATHWAWLKDLASFADATTTYFGGTNPVFDDAITASSKWLEYPDRDTTVFKTPIVDDQFNRFYVASPSLIPSYNTYDRILANDPFWLLGVPPPGCAPLLSVTGGGNTQTLGNTSAGAGTISNAGNKAYLLKITPGGDTQLQDVQFVATTASASAHFAAVVYSDAAGVPDTLMNTGAIETGVVAGNNISAFLNPSNLLNNTSYWIGLITDAPIDFQAGPVEGFTNISSFPVVFSNGPPGQAPAATPNQSGIQMYADLLTSDVIESRSYVYTWVSEYGEEGPPSPPVLLDGWSNGVWTVGLWQPPPNDMGITRNLKKLNLYRTVPATGGSAVFFFVKALDIGTLEYVDTNPNSTIALNDQLASTNWFPPPENLQGFIAMQNGMVAAFKGNEIWFCEPYRPHAWPAGYVLTVEYPIVGLGLTAGSLVVCTSAFAYVISGNAPAAMAQTKCSLAYPCSSRASILSGDGAVTYMSPNGLIQVQGSGVAVNTTDLWFTREKWSSLVPQHDVAAIYLTSCYFAFGTVSADGSDSSVAQQGFTIELDQDNTSFSIWPQPGGHRLGLQLLANHVTDNVQNVLTDPWTDTGLLISGGAVRYYDFTDQAPTPVVYTWRSKLYQQNTKRNYSAMKVFFADVQPALPALNATRVEALPTDAQWATLPADRWGYIKTYADHDGDGELELVDCREIRASGEMLRIVGGFKADTWQWEITGRVTISNVQIATSVKELAQV